MFLAVDIGNTQTTLGLFDDAGAVRRQWRMATDRADTADSLHARLYGYFGMLGLSLADVDEIAIAGVVPTLTQYWQALAREIVGHEPLVVSAARDCGIEVHMPDPTKVGADRIANAVAARETYGAPVIVVDFGTATNVDVVDGKGRFRGGVIMPGLMLSANALFERAAKLSSVPVTKPAHALGATTEAAVQSGLVIGAAAQAEGIVARIEDELRAEDPACEAFTVVGTGGLSSVVAEATDLFDVVDPDITIRGIRQIWLHRAQKRQARG